MATSSAFFGNPDWYQRLQDGGVYAMDLTLENNQRPIYSLGSTASPPYITTGNQTGTFNITTTAGDTFSGSLTIGTTITADTTSTITSSDNVTWYIDSTSSDFTYQPYEYNTGTIIPATTITYYPQPLTTEDIERIVRETIEAREAAANIKVDTPIDANVPEQEEEDAISIFIVKHRRLMKRTIELEEGA